MTKLLNIANGVVFPIDIAKCSAWPWSSGIGRTDAAPLRNFNNVTAMAMKIGGFLVRQKLSMFR